ncbi:hypothetical protein JTE90_002753 [Oedothorax gibbosus]|uniref:Uncharacterized protein n=1 Tax=Oedothorax gibbosus TaxID=931172 RepID=A0AAV6ULQ4_9ARAC|nr:hypothetical protein JTE90_002753 [Oedothorax gibbosus]
MASIGRWLYRQIFKCIPCLKPAKKAVETKDYTEDPNVFGDHGNHNEYPERLNPFKEDEEERKAQEYNVYPEDLNPFNDDEKGQNQQQENEYPEDLNPFSDEKEEIIQQENEYPDSLNPFAVEYVNKQQQKNDYPEDLNPFANKKETSLPPSAKTDTNTDKTLKLFVSDDDSVVEKISPNEESASGALKISGHVLLKYKVSEYDESLNPFASEDEETNANTGVTEAINGSSSLNPLPNEPKTDAYQEALKLFTSDDEEDIVDIIVQQSSLTIAYHQTSPTINISSSSYPLPNERRKGKSKKKYRAPGPPVNVCIMPNAESSPAASETLGLVPLMDKVHEYDESLNPFTSVDEGNTEDATENSPSQLKIATINSSSSLNAVLKERKKGKTIKKRRAPDPPKIETCVPNEESVSGDSRDIRPNESCESSSHPGATKSKAHIKEACPSIYFQ